MPELRRDDLTDRWVLLAPGRAARPHTFPPAARDGRVAAGDCPFCPGHERLTPPEVYRTGEGAPDTPGWRVRVVPNLYPIVGGDDAGPGATGAHEVVVLSPDHDRTFARLDERQATEVFAVLRDRARHHLAAGRAFVQVVINHGRAAGASIEHPHAQLVALDFVPPAVERAVERVVAAGRDLVVADLDAAGEEGRVLDGPVPVWCPSAASTPYELALGRLAAAIGDAPYNLVVHTAPPGTGPDGFHWYIEVQTRIAVVAGFEQGTGILVNTTPPELAARQLREAGV